MCIADLLDKAIILATTAHMGQYDKSGNPYILHPLTVMGKFAPDMRELQIVAVLHDVIEDTSITSHDLFLEGFPEHIVQAVVAITKNDNEQYGHYLHRVKANPLALLVKLEDIAHNMSRLDNLEPDHAGYLARKYTRALQFLRS